MPSTARTTPASKARPSAAAAAKPRRRTAQPEAQARRPDGHDLPRDERVRQLAYAFYEQRGGGDGQAMDDWLRAEQAIEADDVQAARSAVEGH